MSSATSFELTQPLTRVVCADLESLVPTHNQADLAALLVSEQTDLAGTALLPLKVVLCETEKFGAPEI